MNPREIVAAYLLMQAIATASWWCMLLIFPTTAKWFQPDTWPRESLTSFWLADGVFLVAGSLIAAIGVRLQTRWARPAVWSVAIVSWYPTLVCVAVSMQTGQAWIASSLMAGLAGLSLAMATIIGHANQIASTIRPTPMTWAHSLAWTLGQTLIFWGAFLYVFPMGIFEFQQAIPIDSLAMRPFEHRYQPSAASGLFILASSLGLWSGITMAVRGSGTPLPTATAARLVIAGPYRWVRNPMAVAGILQGIAVGWALGSVPVILYALIGGIVWHCFVRPIEEKDLGDRFGQDYFDYRGRVGLWIPKSRSQLPDR